MWDYSSAQLCGCLYWAACLESGPANALPFPPASASREQGRTFGDVFISKAGLSLLQSLSITEVSPTISEGNCLHKGIDRYPEVRIAEGYLGANNKGATNTNSPKVAHIGRVTCRFVHMYVCARVVCKLCLGFNRCMRKPRFNHEYLSYLPLHLIFETWFLVGPGAGWFD